MTQIEQPYRFGEAVAQAGDRARADFIRKTYTHLAGAIGVFMCLEALIFYTFDVKQLVGWMLGDRFSWLLVPVHSWG